MQESCKIKCWVCMDRGFVLYKKTENCHEYEFIAHCVCTEGMKYIYDGSKCKDRKSDYYVEDVRKVFDVVELAKQNYFEFVKRDSTRKEEAKQSYREFLKK